MRVFIGIPFPQDIKEKLYEIQHNALIHANQSQKTSLENFHITLLFIGEVTIDHLEDIIDMMDILFEDEPAFDISLENIGHFIKYNHIILWVGINQGSSHLKYLSKKTYQKLNSFMMHQKYQFTPHLTLARSVKFISGLNSTHLPFFKMTMHIDTIVLFESTRILGNLCYHPIHETKLKK